ncbi:MAG: MBL fold metallo-hydrolase [Coriobacteriia bacterium]|nr:MBL fold metallo-hydrolase [Coriobacteriia bacterium]
MFVRRLVLGALDTNCWVAADDCGGPAVVVDPADDADAILFAVGERKVMAVVLTHKHFDHIGAVRELIARTGAPLWVHQDDAAGLSDAIGTGGAMFGFTTTAPPPDRLLGAGDVLVAGNLRLTVLHTPGHTPGGICLLAEDSSGDPAQLFAGDTLFAGSVGRTDFPGGDARALSHSIATKLVSLPAETIVHPGHGPDTTIGRERRVNPFFPRA